MSFYGKIINYVTNAFTKVNGVDTTQGNDIIFTGDNNLSTIVQTNSNAQIEVKYTHKDSQVNPSTVVVENNQLQLYTPVFDSYGHADTTDNKITLLTFIDDGNGNITISGGGNS